MSNRKNLHSLRRLRKSFLEKLTIAKMPGAGGGLGRVFRAARTPCMKALWLEGA